MPCTASTPNARAQYPCTDAGVRRHGTRRCRTRGITSNDTEQITPSMVYAPSRRSRDRCREAIADTADEDPQRDTMFGSGATPKEEEKSGRRANATAKASRGEPRGSRMEHQRSAESRASQRLTPRLPAGPKKQDQDEQKNALSRSNMRSRKPERGAVRRKTDPRATTARVPGKKRLS